MSAKVKSLTTVIIKRTHRVPKVHAVLNDGTRSDVSEQLSRQLDVALISEGFKANASLITYISSLSNVAAKELSTEIVNTVKEIKGSHVNHNVYFIDFPNNVPDTIEFWSSLVTKTYGEGNEELWNGNLLKLDDYGKYLHSYDEMVAHHEKFIDSEDQTFTNLNLGGSLEDEALKLYTSLATSKVPANGDDLELLKRLAEVCLECQQPEKIPVRENKAVVNSVRVQFGFPIIADTVTDVLRLAAYLSDSDVTLNTKPKFKAFPNKTRKLLLQALDDIVSENENKLGDVYKNRESFKRLFYRLNTTRGKYDNAYRVLEYAVNGVNTSFESKLEKALEDYDIRGAVKILENNPGLFVRSLNRLLLRSRVFSGDLEVISESLGKVLSNVSTPVIIGLRQYLSNRSTQKTYRIFINKNGTGKVIEDTQPVLHEAVLSRVVKKIDDEVLSRIPEGTYVVSRDMLNVALPLSNKQTNDGFGVLPRGSSDAFKAEFLRFFTYWKQNKHHTDFDLSALMLDKDFNQVGQLSYTNLREVGGVHSGDITNAPNGASEFIELEVGKVGGKYIVPQVNVFSGEGFTEVDESFFGYMAQTLDQKGLPFEPKTVKTKAEMRGESRIALPLIFINDGQTWSVKWLNAFIKGYGWGNQTENNALTTAAIVRSIVETEYVKVGYLVNLILSRQDDKQRVFYFEDELAGREDFEGLVESKSNTFYITREVPEWVNDTDVKAITLKNLHELLF